MPWTNALNSIDLHFLTFKIAVKFTSEEYHEDELKLYVK